MTPPTASMSKFACQLLPALAPGETMTVAYRATGGRFVADHYWRQSVTRPTTELVIRLRHSSMDMLGHCSAVEELADGSEVSAAEVIRVLIDRDPRRTPADAEGWRVVSMPGKSYPGMLPDSHASASGDLLGDLTPAEWTILDAFENPIYQITNVALVGSSNAWAYCLPVPGKVRQTGSSDLSVG
ncbi:MAG: gamma-glutamylcyclotransferase family protein [Angustibacter sp.]